MEINKFKTFEGKVARNIYGNWSDVDKGLFVDHDDVTYLLSDYEGKRIRLTIEILPDNDED